MSTFCECLQASPPGKISRNWNEPWFVFIDAFFQPTDVDMQCGLGGVLVGPNGKQVAAFSFVLDFKRLEALGCPRMKTVIFEAELLALIVAMRLWSRHIAHQSCMFFIDNNSASDVAISGHARTEPGMTLAGTLLMLEDSIGVLAWYARVASSPNIADTPSRCFLDGIEVPYVDPGLVSLALDEITPNLPTG